MDWLTFLVTDTFYASHFLRKTKTLFQIEIVDSARYRTGSNEQHCKRLRGRPSRRFNTALFWVFLPSFRLSFRLSFFPYSFLVKAVRRSSLIATSTWTRVSLFFNRRSIGRRPQYPYPPRKKYKEYIQGCCRKETNMKLRVTIGKFVKQNEDHPLMEEYQQLLARGELTDSL